MAKVSIVDRTDFIQTAKKTSRILQSTFTAIPIIAGLDKFFYILTDWSNYLAPFFSNLLNMEPVNFMYIVGIIEIAAGVGVALRPAFFARVVSFWMFAIVVNLFILGSFYDIALRDFGLGVSALVLGRLSAQLTHIKIDVDHEQPPARFKRAA